MRYLIVPVLLLLSASTFAQTHNAAKNAIALTAATLTQTTPLGFGAQYDRSIDKSGKWNFTVPVSYSFGNSNPCDPTIKTRMFRAYPGVKFYPAGNDHRVNYAIGASAVVGVGSSNCNCDAITDDKQKTQLDATAPASDNQFSNRTEAGVMINNALTMQACKHTFIGAELGLGSNYVNYKSIAGAEFAFRFSFNIGYRF
jgi:hypothetical protein